jgi:HEAT repeat protein
MIRLKHSRETALGTPLVTASMTALIMALIGTVIMTGCADMKAKPRPGEQAEAKAKAKAESLVNAVVAPATTVAVEPAPAPATPAASIAAESGGTGPSIADLVTKLGASADSGARVLVIDEIGALGQPALPALTGLVAAFADEDSRVRWHAARAVGLIGEDARSAIPALVTLLADTDPIVVTQAAAALGHIREDDGRGLIPEADAKAYATAVDPLAKTTVHPDARARRASMRALRRYSMSLADMAPIVSKHLADADPAVVVSALHTLADMDDDAVPLLIEALKDPKSRYWAEVALAEIGPKAAAAVEPLAKAVEVGEAEERLQAILALAAIGEPAAAAAPAIIAVLDSNDATLQMPAAFALGRMKAAAGDASLAKAVAGEDPFLASVASWARARIHPDDKALVDDALARLRVGLANADAEIRSGSVSGLSDLAESLDASARERLAGEFMPLLTDADPEVGQAAGGALVRLGSAAMATLQPKLADPAIRRNILEILAAIGPAAKPALGEIVGALGDADPQCRGDAAMAIAAIGPDAAEAVPELQKLLVDPAAADGLRYVAAYALGRIGPAAGAAEPVLRELSLSKDELLATVAIWAALKIKPNDASLFESAVPLLRRALRGDRELARLEAAVALGDIGPAAAAAVPLLELVSEEDPAREVRAAAAAAIQKIKAK